MSTPVHPEAVPGSADELRWVMRAGTLGFAGTPAALPAVLQALYDDGVLQGPAVVEPAAVRLRIAPGRSWRTEGAAVRRALQAALSRPGEWTPPAGAGLDDLLRAAAEKVLAGEVGAYVASHGGELDVVDVTDGRVTIALGGACEGCPASGFTVQSRFEAAVRRLCPQLVEVVAHEAPARSGLLRLLPTRH